jgi:dTDP-glucose pyrophosphorylase
LSFLLFPVEHPEFFDAVLTDDSGRVSEIRVKQQNAGSNWIWGAFKMPGAILRELHHLWNQRGQKDEYIGTLVNAYIASGAEVAAVPAGKSYVDIGTLHGYHAAISLLSSSSMNSPQAKYSKETENFVKEVCRPQPPPQRRPILAGRNG